MAEPNDAPRPSSPVRQPVLLGLFAGTAVGGGYLLAGIPNVEVMSLITAVAGVVLGPARGFLAGALAAAVYSLGSPYGLPAPLLLAAQMAGLGSAGPIGHLVVRGHGARDHRTGRAIALAAAGGLVITVIHDVLTNLAILGMLDLPAAAVLAGAVPFFLVHAVSNLVIFGALLPSLAHRLARLARPRLTGRPGPLAVGWLGLGLVLGAGALPGATPGFAQSAPALADSLPVARPSGTAAADSASDSLGTTIPPAAQDVAPPPPPVGGAAGWRRPLWTPFHPGWLAWADRESPWLTFVDGGVGASARLSGEAGTQPLPLVVRDGVPLGTGHALVDDAWFVGIEGVKATAGGLGADGWGGTGGVVALQSRDDDPKRAISSYRGSKGRHESYYRGVDFLSPRADWRLGFSFEESLDNEGYNHTLTADEDFALLREDGFPGQGKVRQSRTRLQRAFPDGNEISVEIGSGRRTRDDLPALGAGSLEAWDRSAAVRMRWLTGGWDLRPVLYWNERDVLWGPRWVGVTPPSELRLLESGRQGIRVDLRRRSAAAPVTAPGTAAAPVTAAVPAAADTTQATATVAADTTSASSTLTTSTLTTSPLTPSPLTTGAAVEPTPPPLPATGLPLFSLSAQGWTLRDNGTRAEWAGADTLAIAGDGGEVRLAFGWEGGLAGARAQAELGALAGGGLGLGPDARLGLAQRPQDPRWQASLEWGGRAPRSDELLTPVRYVVAARSLVVLPAADLRREQTVRASLAASTRLLGLDLAAVAGARHLADGIAWRAEDGYPDRGRWANDLELASWRLTTSAARAGRFLGWARLKAEGTWQGFDVTAGQPGALPPEQWQRLRLDWENHFFREDGILQVSLLTTRRAASADPWDVTGSSRLPARTNHDLLVGFRLVGAHLTMGFRNLTGQRQQLTSGALSPGMEMDLRLEWAFHQ